jgi:two-component system, OmpR family, sensor kinase
MVRYALARASERASMSCTTYVRGGWGTLTAAGEFTATTLAVTTLLALASPPAMHLQAERAADIATGLALFAAAAGAGSGALLMMSARMRRDPCGIWLCLALLIYTLVAIPAATIGATSSWDEAVVGNVRLFAHIGFVALIYLTALATTVPQRLTVAGGMLGMLTAGGVLALAGKVYPSVCLGVTTSPATRWILVGFWLVGPLVLLGRAIRGHSAMFYRVGLALEVVAVAHALRLDEGSPTAPLGVSFALLRLLGIGILFCVAVGAFRQCLSSVDSANDDQQRQLQHARLTLEQARERDHELRNGLAGLACATSCLFDGDGDSAALRRAVVAEVARLHTMVRIPSNGMADARDHSASSEEAFSVEDVLVDQVSLRRSSALDIRLESDSQLLAAGTPAVLAQVISNLLTNCEHHAPGSPVHIRARTAGATVRISVTDFGPGIPAAIEGPVFERGQRGAGSSGQGIGLYVSSRLLRASSGTMSIAPSSHDGTGCTVTIDLPRAPSKSDLPLNPNP